MVEYCNWVRYFGDYAFKTDCGHYQGIEVRPKQKICFCGKRIKGMHNNKMLVLSN